MKHSLHITASLDKVDLLEHMVEKLAIKHLDNGYYNAVVPKYHKAMETSSIESYVSGNMELGIDGTETIRMPFISCFLFTCTREKREEYKLNWSFSLS